VLARSWLCRGCLVVRAIGALVSSIYLLASWYGMSAGDAVLGDIY
jgi:hypothetical protein